MKRRNETFIFESITEHREFIYLYFIYIQNTNQSGEKKSLVKRKKKVLRKFLQPAMLSQTFTFIMSFNQLFYFSFFYVHASLFSLLSKTHMDVFICFGYYLYNFTKSREKTGGNASYMNGWMEYKEC